MNAIAHHPSTVSPIDLFGDLPLMRVTFHVRVDADASLPPFTGSAWRGLLGRQVQRLVCPFRKRPACRDCLIKGHCPYALLIEEENALPGLSEAPRGYVLSPADGGAAGEIDLTLTLFGACARFLPVVAMAVMEGRRVGLGRDRTCYEVAGMTEHLPRGEAASLALAPDQHVSASGPFPLRQWLDGRVRPSERIRLRFATPVRLRKKGRYLDRMDWPFYFESLARRLEALHCLFHEGQPMGKARWLEMKEGFRFDGNIRGDLHWRDLSRFSGRQRQKIPMGGLVGEAVMDKPSRVETAWWRAAELVHVGKGVVMGLGRVEIF